MRRSALAIVSGALLLFGGGCSLFLLDGLNEDDPAAPADAASSEVDAPGSGPGAPDAPATPGDGSADGGDPDPYGTAVAQDEPAGWWRLDEAPGALQAKDATKGQHHADINGTSGVTFRAPGATAGGGTAYVLDGNADLSLGDVFDFPGNVPFSIEAWVKPAAHDGVFRHVFTKMDFAPLSPDQGTYLYVHGVDMKVGLERWVDASTAIQNAIVDRKLPLERFTHIVVTHDGFKPRLYVDGQLLVIGNNNGPVPDIPTPAVWGNAWIGAVDELAIYDKALSSMRVLAHYEAAQKK